jgi:transcriptional regulator with XRE-family HTH domain
MEELAAYLHDVMKAKGIKGVDIEARSGGKITNSYISDIMHGNTKNISVEKVNALAEGLGVDSFEVFQAASGNRVVQGKDSWPSYTLLLAMQSVIQNPDLTVILKTVLNWKPAKIKALRKQIEGAGK